MSDRPAPRDASWYRNPDVHSFKVVHVNNGDDFALCNPAVPLCDSPSWDGPAAVPENIRCRRAACAAAYAQAGAS